MSDVLKQIAAKSGGKIKTGINPGEGAFYGPKFEYVLRDAIGRDWQCGTVQVDFNMPERLGAFYIDADGEKKTPVMIHRAMFGSMERFAGILLESTAGHLPLWLAPVQAKVCTIVSDADAYAEEALASLQRAGLRAEVDLRNEKINYKVREHSLAKVPVLLVVGKREAEEGTVSVRRMGVQEQQVMPLAEAIAMLADEATPPDLAREHAARRQARRRRWRRANRLCATCFPPLDGDGLGGGVNAARSTLKQVPDARPLPQGGGGLTTVLAALRQQASSFEVGEPGGAGAGQRQADDDGLGVFGNAKLDGVGFPVRAAHRRLGHGQRRCRHGPRHVLGLLRAHLDVEVRGGAGAFGLGAHGGAEAQPLAAPGLGGEGLLQPALAPAPRRGRAVQCAGCVRRRVTARPTARAGARVPVDLPTSPIRPERRRCRQAPGWLPPMPVGGRASVCAGRPRWRRAAVVVSTNASTS